MNTTWDISTCSAHVVVNGLIEEPIDDTEVSMPFDAEFTTRVLPGVAAYLASRQPWDLWVGADGGFDRDGGRCSIIALQFGWSSFGSEDQVEIVATVRHDTRLDITASEPQRLITVGGEDLVRLRAEIDRLRERAAHPMSTERVSVRLFS